MRRRKRTDSRRRLEARIAELERILNEQKERIEELEAELAKARKNSSTSSKPPSSDIVKPSKPAKRGKKKRKQGAQPGHPRHQRAAFLQEDIDTFHDHHLDSCPDCGGDLRAANANTAARVVQQIEINEKPVSIEEHRAHAYFCPKCQKLHFAPLPPEIKRAGLAGPRLTALVAYLKGACHASFSTIRKFLRDVVKISVSRGYLRKLIARVANALEAIYEELHGSLPFEPRLNVDETGHKENGEKFWTWCFRAKMYTLFKIEKSRGSKVLIELLGEEFNGVLGCDYFSAYHKYMGDFGVEVQFCLAHLIRDVKFLKTLPEKSTRNYGERVLKKLRELFRVIHRRQTMTEGRFQSKLEKARDALLATAKRAPLSSKAQNIARRFRKHGDAYFRFITTPGVAPTNNLAEQAIRFVVIDRRITQGTRSAAGRQWCERIWTLIATCAQQRRSIFEFLHKAIRAYLEAIPPPSLLPNTS